MLFGCASVWQRCVQGTNLVDDDGVRRVVTVTKMFLRASSSLFSARKDSCLSLLMRIAFRTGSGERFSWGKMVENCHRGVHAPNFDLTMQGGPCFRSLDGVMGWKNDATALRWITAGDHVFSSSTAAWLIYVCVKMLPPCIIFH